MIGFEKNLRRNLPLLVSAFILSVAAVSCMKGDIDADMGLMPEYPSEPDQIAGPESGDKFDEIPENDFVKTSEQAISTFSVDADGASYAYMRTCLRKGYLPVSRSVRIEEFLNYFTFDYPQPSDDNTIAINGEVGPCPWNSDHKLMRLGICGRSISQEETPDANFVFLIDVSGSMNSSDKLPLLKAGLTAMVDYMRPTDRISIVTYSGKAEMTLESTLCSEANTIKNAISKLVASGSTAGGKAMKMAYEEALANFIEDGNNRVIMGTDGDFNVGVTSTDALLEMVQDYAEKGIYLTVCGFGTGNLNDSMMETISNHGNGTYQYIDCEDELTKVFVNERSKFVSVANDTKIQVKFNPQVVDSYRLIGYENRALSQEDFENDKKDAGEIGAGQTVTALYEIIPARNPEGVAASFDCRYKKSLSSPSILLSKDISYNTSDYMSSELSFACGIAAYGMILKQSRYKGDASFGMVRTLLHEGLGFDPYGYRKDILPLLDVAEKMMDEMN